MKKLIIFICLLTNVFVLNAQTKLIQNGLVREINSDKAPLSDVSIKFTDAPSAKSGTDGIFRLAFQDKIGVGSNL